MSDRLAEIEQLNDFHDLAAAKDGPAQASLLRNGFLPESQDVLIEAGIRCIPLIESGKIEVSDAAANRLEAILFKLKRFPETQDLRRAADQFEAIIGEHKRDEISNTRFGFTIFFGLAVLIAGVIVLITYLLMK